MTAAVVGVNKVVYLTYSILDQSGIVFEQNDTPTGYVHGANSGLFEKVEIALEGHRIGDRIEVSLDPEEGFGQYDPLLTFTDLTENMPPECRYVGAEVEFSNRQGESMPFWVSHIADGKTTVDGNHPLAGQTVTFIVNVVNIRDARPAEIASGLEVKVAKACAEAAARARLRNWAGNLRGFLSRMWP
jgi:FKBP-type peptidyl-prolyl cis-trans isomerase SlyD